MTARCTKRRLGAIAPLLASMFVVGAGTASAQDALVAADRKAWFGELHIHSSWSFDSYFHGVRATPEDAYRYNTGEPVEHYSGRTVRPAAALDFMALTDHAEYLGFMPLFDDSSHPLSRTPFAERVTSPDLEVRLPAFLSMTGNDPDKLPKFAGDLGGRTLRAMWRNYVALADAWYRPGEFTTFPGFEWTALPNGQNLHRNVIFRDSNVPGMPFSSLDSGNPEDLWDWLDAVRNDGSGVLAIPHNSNISNGLMFASEKFDGSPIDAAYAEQRLRNEPLVEVTQIKGTSETHPALSPLDEWAGFELLETLIGRHDVASEPRGSYVRQAYQDGLRMATESGFNPYRFGLIGSSDGHNATSPVEERNYTGKLGRLDATAEARRGGNPLHPVTAKYSAAGLAGVWAEENTRESIFAALQRKEAFATSGPRIRLRFFAGWDYDAELLRAEDWPRQAYRRGVPMGGRLSGPAYDSPWFIVQAVKDPAGTWLQRVQVVKGWIENGSSHEKVIDIACSDGLQPNAATGRCPDNGATVDPATCDVSRDRGDVELRTTWRDPDFDPSQPAFYYVRVLENPSCRWTTWDAIRNGFDLQDGIPPTIQERAWSSPVWYRPST